MEKKYEQTLFQKIKELFVVVIGGVALTVICMIVLATVYSIWPTTSNVVYIIIIVIFAAVFLIVLFSTIRDFFDRFYVVINNSTIYIHESKKVEYTFEIENNAISYRIETGSNGFKGKLTFVDLEGKEVKVDVSKLGETKTWQIIEDLKLDDVNLEENIIKL